MQKETINKYLKHFQQAQKENIPICEYCEKNLIEIKRFYNFINRLKKDKNINEEERESVLNIWESVKSKRKNSKIKQLCLDFDDKVETDDVAETSYIRDEDGKIKFYKYQIFRKNKAPLSGRLTREEMNTIHRLYSYYGDSLTQRVISRHFVDLSLIDFKRILRAFNITKASAPFAPHMIEECTENELRDIQLREKENSFLRKAEEDQIKNNEKLLKKYAQENIALKQQLEILSNITIDINDADTPYYTSSNVDNIGESALNIYLSDVHLGAAVETGSLYDENNNYGYEEAKRRLEQVIERLSYLGSFSTVNICLLGDNLDCCGHAGFTASMTHQMPENMDPRDQFNKFIKLYDWFIRSINENGLAERQINVYSVPTGNHSGSFEYALNNTLKYYTEARFPNIKFTLFDKFFGVFEQNSIPFVLTHGKSDKFMKKGMPLNLDDKNKVKIYEWLDDNKLYGDNIHIIKGDLHSNNLNSCKRFTYRNVLSLFGASDYSSYGFSRNSYGISYDVIYGNEVMSGTIENI